MTQEEYEQEQREIERLINQINALVNENNYLVSEINLALENINVLRKNVVTLHRSLEPRMNRLSSKVSINSDHIEQVRDAIKEMARQYFTYKALCTASKNVTRYTDEYHTKFSYYNELRRITLGYVIGLDSNFVSSEKMRNMVERVYLQNTEYWLSYATMAMMLWASDEEEAAKRAMDKAMFLSQNKASMYFMIINLRFGRTEIAREWFVYYMDLVNPSDLGSEWQYLLQAYLAGVFGVEERFQQEVGKYFKRMLVQSEATTADFSKRFVDRAYSHADTYLHTTKENFAYLKGACKNYDELIELLSSAEKNAVLAEYYDKLMREENNQGEDIAQKLENILYDLVNEYDETEMDVVKRLKLNEYIIAAKGDQTAARKKFDIEFPKHEDRNFADYLNEWAFVEDSRLTSLSVRKFSISFTKDWIYKGYEKFIENYRSKVQDTYKFNIDGCEFEADENGLEECKDKINTYYEKNKKSMILGDKFTLIYGLITIVGLLCLVVMGVQLAKGTFSPVALTIGILLVLVGAFLLWRQIVSVLEIIKEKQRLSIQRMQHVLEELGQWRKLFEEEDKKAADLKDALARFSQDKE